MYADGLESELRLGFLHRVWDNFRLVKIVREVGQVRDCVEVRELNARRLKIDCMPTL